MSVRKLSDGKYQIDYYPLGRKGKRVRVTYKGSETEARLLEAELRRQHSGNTHQVNPKIIDIIPEYIEWLELQKANNTGSSGFRVLPSI